MGEISEALRRANARKENRKRSGGPPPPREGKQRQTKDSFPISFEKVTADVREQETTRTPVRPASTHAPLEARRDEAPAPTPMPEPTAEEVRVVAAEAGEDPLSPEAKAAMQLVLSRGKSDLGWRSRSVLMEDSQTAEQYRHFAIRLGRELSRRNIRTVMMVSALRSEGKTTTSCNAAIASATIAGGRRTALVDLDLRRPSVGKTLDVHPVKGIDTVLSGHATLEEARVATDLPSLDLYPVAHSMNQAHEYLAGPALPRALAELEKSYDLVICDSPPVLLVPDVALLAPHVGGYVVVLRSRQTLRQAFTRLLEILPREKILGTFLNDIRLQRLSKYHTSYYRSDEYGEATEQS